MISQTTTKEFTGNPLTPLGNLFAWMGLKKKSGPDDTNENVGAQALEAPPPRLVQIVVPKRLDKDGLVLHGNGETDKKLPFDVIQSIALGAIKEPKNAYLVLDLILPQTSRGASRTMRVLSHQFNPRRLIPAGTPTEALLIMVQLIRDHAAAWPLPSPEALQGKPFATFGTLEQFESAINWEGL